MKNILARTQREVLARFAGSKALLGFDFDGTLAPIVADPGRAALRASTRRLLARLAGLYPCVVISGRAAWDVARRMEGIALRGVVGNHGSESLRAGGAAHATVARWKKFLAPRLAPLAGVELEDKGFSLALHYRRARKKKETMAAIRRALAALGEVRVIGGKQVVNLLPVDAPHKGEALEEERLRLGCARALFLGDDDTDEDVFAHARAGRLLGVRVGAKRSSKAAYCLKSQAEVDALLVRLIELRTRPGRMSRTR